MDISILDQQAYSFFVPARVEPVIDAINFYDDLGEILFHVSIRYNLSEIVLNKTQFGVWQTEGKFNFLPLYDFIITISFQELDACVYIDGVEVATYHLGLPASCTVLQTTLQYLDDSKVDIVQPQSDELVRKNIFAHDVMVFDAVQISKLPLSTLQLLARLPRFMFQFPMPNCCMVIDATFTNGLAVSLLSAAISDIYAIILYDDDSSKEQIDEILKANFSSSNVITCRSSDVKDKLANLLMSLCGKTQDGFIDKEEASPLVDICLTKDQIKEIDIERVISMENNNKYKLGLIADVGCLEEDCLNCRTKLVNQIQEMLMDFDFTWRFIQSDAPYPASFYFKYGININTCINIATGMQRLVWHGVTECSWRPGLDVVVALYNNAAYVCRTISSILSDDRDDIRVIVVDDGSTDDGAHVVRQQYGDDFRVTVVSKHNGGCASARNYGRLISKSSHIAFIDADDFVEQDSYANAFDVAMYTGYEIVQFAYCEFDDAMPSKISYSKEAEAFSKYDDEPFNDTSYKIIPSSAVLMSAPGIWRRVYRRDFIDSRKIFFLEHVRAYDDWLFFVISIYHAREVIHLDSGLYYYRQHAGQDVKRTDERHFAIFDMQRVLIIKIIEEGWNEIYPVVAAMMGSICWSLELIKPSLFQKMLEQAAETILFIEKALCVQIVENREYKQISHPDFDEIYRHKKEEFSHIDSYAIGYFGGVLTQPDTLCMQRVQEIK